MPTILAAMSGVPFKLQDTQITGNGTILAIPPSFRNHTFIITATVGVTSGAVTLETSNDPTNTGVWAQLSSPVTVVAGADLIVQITGILNFIRARINSTIIGSGSPSVTVIYEGAKSY